MIGSIMVPLRYLMPYLPQAKLANEAIRQKIMEMSAQSPKCDYVDYRSFFRNHDFYSSGGQSPQADLAKIDKVVLFQGPDARKQ